MIVMNIAKIYKDVYSFQLDLGVHAEEEKVAVTIIISDQINS